MLSVIGRRSDASEWRREKDKNWIPQDSKSISASHRVASIHENVIVKSRVVEVKEIKVQVISDTHLEYPNKDPKTELKITGNIICLCGDIGFPGQRTYQNFVKWCSQNYELVFVVTGNHEYYDKKNTKQTIDLKLSNFIGTLKNVYLMSEGAVIVKSDFLKYKFVGTTLWTPVGSSSNSELISKEISDYKKITVDCDRRKADKLSLDNVHEWHQQELEFLKKEIYTAYDGEIIPTIVLTHHLPSKQFLSIRGDLDDAYAGDIDFLLKMPVITWCYGHTHRARIELHNGILIISNPFGHIGDDTGFNPGQVFDYKLAFNA